MKRVAAIDCGTNSIRLLIAGVTNDSKLIDLQPRKTRINRLGLGVDKTRVFAREALDRTFEIEEEFAQDLKIHQIPSENIRFVATSASRDARNRDLFFDKSFEILGVYPEVISGEEEAKLSFSGVASVLDLNKELSRDRLVIDLGGGSTELIYDGVGYSMNIGSVRFTERYFNYGVDESAMQVGDIDGATLSLEQEVSKAVDFFKKHDIDLKAAKSVVGVAGTVTSVTAFALGLEKYDSKLIDKTALSISDVNDFCDKFLNFKKSEIANLKFLNPGRVDVIAAGCFIWKNLLRIIEAKTIITSEHDILDGIALSI